MAEKKYGAGWSMEDLQELSEKLGNDGQIFTGNDDDGTWSEVEPKEIVSGREIVHELIIDDELSIVITKQRNQWDKKQTRYCTHLRIQQGDQDYTVSGNYDLTLFGAKEDAKKRYYRKGGK
jgi:hypothetical protein|tara:strand:- start:377 stop:739 length:363 start_codon:yes stop_codon:yes gene_type:complete